MDNMNPMPTNNGSATDEINSQAFNGSMQRILQDNIGAYVIIEFLIGTNNLVYREGRLYEVGISYVVLYDEKNDQYTICDLYAIKFVTYVNQGRRPSRPTMARTTPSNRR